MAPNETGAVVLARTLAACGIRHLFGIPGVHTLPFYDALSDVPEIAGVVTRHEAGATFAADAYARVSGCPAAVSVVPGPGALNAATGVLCAWSDRVPMLVITVEIEAGGRAAQVHEGDLEAAYRPFTKAQVRAREVEGIERSVRMALETAVRSPAGPVQVLVPAALLSQRAHEDGTTQSYGSPEGSARESVSIPGEEIRRLLDFLRQCSAPTLMFGRELSLLSQEAQALTERLGAPAFSDVGARGIIPEDHPLAAGLLTWQGANEILDASDGMLVLGSRLSEISTLNWSARLPANLARIDADPMQLDTNYPATLQIEADPAAVLQCLAHQVALDTRAGGNGAVHVLQTVRARQMPGLVPKGDAGIHPRAAVRGLRDALPRDAIVTTDGTATEFWLSEESFPVFAPAGFIVPEVQQTMGFGLGAAVGAAVACSAMRSARPVVLITGDGSLQMMLGEMATAAALGRQLLIVIFDDGYYNALRIYQDGLYGRQTGVRLENPDFALIARAYGAHAQRVASLDELVPAVSRALTEPRLHVIDLAIDPGPLPDRYARRLKQMR
jgi:acetolactate synthase I/II/III large subunit